MTHSCNRSNNQDNSIKPWTNKTVKNDKKEWPTAAEASNEERMKDKRLKFLKNKQTN